jgi:TniQ
VSGAPLPLDGSLYISPPPFPREAMTSWLFRTAAAHGCSWSRMRDLLYLKEDEDVDFSWPWDLESSAEFLAVPVEALTQLLTWRQSFVAHDGAFGLVMGTATAPKFSVCARCVREQKAMHYCVESRFDFVTLCPVHGTPMFVKNRNRAGGESYVRTSIGATSNGRVGGATAAQRSNRFELERRIRAAVKIGYERHPILGTIPVQTLLAAEAWRLRPRVALRNPESWSG